MGTRNTACACTLVHGCFRAAAACLRGTRTNFSWATILLVAIECATPSSRSNVRGRCARSRFFWATTTSAGVMLPCRCQTFSGKGVKSARPPSLEAEILTCGKFFPRGTPEFRLRNAFRHNRWEKYLAIPQHVVQVPPRTKKPGSA